MKNKGFTLVELIAIIIILGVITTLTFASLTKSIKNAELKEVETFNKTLESATQLFVETRLDEIPELSNAGQSFVVNLNTLIDYKYVKADITNPTDCDMENIIITATKNANMTISYTVGCNR